jgi:hypothetical protein
VRSRILPQQVPVPGAGDFICDIVDPHPLAKEYGRQVAGNSPVEYVQTIGLKFFEFPFQGFIYLHRGAQLAGHLLAIHPRIEAVFPVYRYQGRSDPDPDTFAVVSILFEFFDRTKIAGEIGRRELIRGELLQLDVSARIHQAPPILKPGAARGTLTLIALLIPMAIPKLTGTLEDADDVTGLLVFAD